MKITIIVAIALGTCAGMNFAGGWLSTLYTHQEEQLLCEFRPLFEEYKEQIRESIGPLKEHSTNLFLPFMAITQSINSALRGMEDETVLLAAEQFFNDPEYRRAFTKAYHATIAHHRHIPHAWDDACEILEQKRTGEPLTGIFSPEEMIVRELQRIVQKLFNESNNSSN